MKKSLLITVSVITLTGCGGKADNDWSDNCIKHHSETGREFRQCLEKVKHKIAAKRQTQQTELNAQRIVQKYAEEDNREIPAGIVSIDPEGPTMESFKETGKTTRGGPEVPDTEK